MGLRGSALALAVVLVLFTVGAFYFIPDRKLTQALVVGVALVVSLVLLLLLQNQNRRGG